MSSNNTPNPETNQTHYESETEAMQQSIHEYEDNGWEI